MFHFLLAEEIELHEFIVIIEYNYTFHPIVSVNSTCDPSLYH